MKTIRKIQTLGGSLLITLPSDAVRDLQLKHGGSLEIDTTESGIITMRPVVLPAKNAGRVV